MAVISCHAGDAAFMSMTEARANAGSPPPARRILPGAYMAPHSAYPLLPNGFVGPSLQVPVARFKIPVVVLVAASYTRPFGKTYMNGYRPWLRRAFVSTVQVFVIGL